MQVRTLRRSLAEVAQQGRVDEASGQLHVGGHPVAVVYFRAGYSPDDYHSEQDWQAR